MISSWTMGGSPPKTLALAFVVCMLATSVTCVLSQEARGAQEGIRYTIPPGDCLRVPVGNDSTIPGTYIVLTDAALDPRVRFSQSTVIIMHTKSPTSYEHLVQLACWTRSELLLGS
jgi:hypothetical protein